MRNRWTRPDSPSAATDEADRVTPGRVTAAVAACTGLLAAFIWFAPALGTVVFGALVTASLTAFFVAVAASVGFPLVGTGRGVPWAKSATRITGRISTGRRGLAGPLRVFRGIHRPAAGLSSGVAATVLYAWSVELGALRSGYAAGTLAGGLAYAVLASRLPRR